MGNAWSEANMQQKHEKELADMKEYLTAMNLAAIENIIAANQATETNIIAATSASILASNTDIKISIVEVKNIVDKRVPRPYYALDCVTERELLQEPIDDIDKDVDKDVDNDDEN